MAIHQIQSKAAAKAAREKRAKPAPSPRPKERLTLALLVGSRGFFPGHLANSGREEMTARLAKAGYDVVVLTPNDTTHGAVQTRADAKKCSVLFKANRDRIAGVIVTLPNFGDEAAIGDTLRLPQISACRCSCMPGATKRKRWASPTAAIRSAEKCRRAM